MANASFLAICFAILQAANHIGWASGSYDGREHLQLYVLSVPVTVAAWCGASIVTAIRGERSTFPAYALCGTFSGLVIAVAFPVAYFQQSALWLPLPFLVGSLSVLAMLGAARVVARVPGR
jgi:hypothetical protein